jgi:hypothetical protein
MPDRPAVDQRSIRFCTPLVLVAALLLAGISAPAALAKPGRPTVAQFAFSPPTFAVGPMRTSTHASRATTISFALSERSTVRISISRKLSGRRAAGGRCVKPTAKLAKRRACTRFTHRATLTRKNLRAGQRKVAFSGRIRGRALSPGTYRARISATDSGHHRSRVRTTMFTIQGATGAPAPAPTPQAPPPAPGAQRRTVRPCSVTLPNAAALQSAASSAAAGSVLCLAPGTYGRLSLSAKAPSEVVVQPAGSATIAGATLAGSHLTLEGFNVTDEIDIQPGSDHVAVQFNQISGGYFGVNAGPTTTTTVNDAVIRGNKFVGPFGEDAIRLNRYHDGDGDGVGILIEGNEITGVRENGNHSDCLQAVWVGDHLVFRRNYLHDNRCQGFFIKDQQSAVDGVIADDNLMLRNAAPCAIAGCGQPAIFQLFGPMNNLVMTRNTIWTPEGGSPVTLRDSGWGPVQVTNNVVYRFWSDTSAPFANYTASNNIAAQREMSWPATGVTISSNPGFLNPAADDYRTRSGVGVDWAPADQQYGP